MELKKWKWRAMAAMAAALAAPCARAAVIFTLNPVDGVVSGNPGDTVGWGFTLTTGSTWVAIDSVSIENETSPVSGTNGGFTSYMDVLGGLSDGVTPPNSNWTLPFATGSPGQGVGAYAIDAGTPAGASDSGDFVIFYDEFSDNPNTCGSCFLDTQQIFDSNGDPPAFTINVATQSSNVPEPASAWLALMTISAVGWARRGARNAACARYLSPAVRERNST